jgi:hypothetical protein
VADGRHDEPWNDFTYRIEARKKKVRCSLINAILNGILPETLPCTLISKADKQAGDHDFSWEVRPNNLEGTTPQHTNGPLRPW